MKIPLNLASQPFRRDRALLAASIAVTVLLVCTLGVLVWIALVDRTQMADVRAEISRLSGNLRKVGAEQEKLATVLRRPENAEVLETSIFLNTLLLRKAISWTKIFADLENTVPYNVKVVQIHPSMDAQNQVALDMTVASEQPTALFEFLKGMAQDPRFGNVQLGTVEPPKQNEKTYKFHLRVPYAQKL